MRFVILLGTLLLCASAVSIKSKLSTFTLDSNNWDGGKRRIGDMDVWLEDDLQQIWGNDMTNDSIHGFMHDWISNQWLAYDYAKSSWSPIPEDNIPSWAWEALEDYENENDGDGEWDDDGEDDDGNDGDGEGEDDDGCKQVECDENILPNNSEAIDGIWWYGWCEGDLVNYSAWDENTWIETKYYYNTKECTWLKDEMAEVPHEHIPDLLHDIINGDFNPEDYESGY